MPSVVERVRARGLPPPAGISYALNLPDWSLVTRIERSSGEKEAPNMAVVFMNCSIVYWRTGRVGRALCAAAVPRIMLARASSGRVRRRYESGRRTGSSGGGRSNLAVFRPPWSATLCPSPSERSPYRKPSVASPQHWWRVPRQAGGGPPFCGRLFTRASPDETTAQPPKSDAPEGPPGCKAPPRDTTTRLPQRDPRRKRGG